jgi:hypothetical protein
LVDWQNLQPKICGARRKLCRQTAANGALQPAYLANQVYQKKLVRNNQDQECRALQV